MTFSGELAAIVRNVKARSHSVFIRTVTLADESIRFGSPITGAPGQPVDTGNLRNSWQTTFPDEHTAQISTNVEYAPYVEDNVNGVEFHNHGPHSVKLTIAGMSRLLEQAVREEDQ